MFFYIVQTVIVSVIAYSTFVVGYYLVTGGWRQSTPEVDPKTQVNTLPDEIDLPTEELPE